MSAPGDRADQMARALAQTFDLDAALADALRDSLASALSVWAPPRAPVPPTGQETPGSLGRYTPIRKLGAGGMGEVWAVRDPALERALALKILRPEIAPDPAAEARFREEAKVTAQLQHPGVVPIYEMGALPDGRRYFTMKIVEGETLSQVIAGLHAGEEGWTLRRLVGALLRVCEAVAYAHDRGVLHRDLKPENVMLGPFGEALVLDWGLARLRPKPPSIWDDDLDDEALDGELDGAGRLTVAGAVLGTPVYMPPEQALGEPLTPAADVYALGACLFEILTGRQPFAGPGAMAILGRVVRGEREPLRGDLPIPPPLARICDRAMSPVAADRYPDAGAMARAISGWMDGARLRAQATAVLDRADALRPKVRAARADAERLRAEALALLADVRSYDPIEQKRPAWDRQTEADRLEQEALRLEHAWTQELHAALNILPGLPEARARLAEHYRLQHAAAERRRQPLAAQRLELLLRSYDDGRHAAYLKGDGALTLRTDPPGAEALLCRFAERDRRLEPIFERSLGASPLIEVPLPRGDYLLVLRCAGFDDVRYPVQIGRQEHWHGVPPGADEALPIWLPPSNSLGPGERYVPAGWFWSGGDPDATDSLPRRRVWAPGFAIRRDPVTTGEYLAFLNDLAARDPDRAAAMAPKRLGVDEAERFTCERGPGGRYRAIRGADQPWPDDLPIVQIDLHQARAFAAWTAERTGQPWRLPHELEWEKAARGVSGRAYPWGDFHEHTWLNALNSTASRPALAAVGAHPLDVSLYGARGMAGNVSEWCGNAYEKAGCPPIGERSVPLGFSTLRGGNYINNERVCRLASRLAARPGDAFRVLGARLARAI